MSYDTIKTDCESVGSALQRVAEFLEAELVNQAEDPTDPLYYPGWQVRLSQTRTKEIADFLIGAAGLVQHLGTEQDAAGALLRQHSVKPVMVPSSPKKGRAYNDDPNQRF